jgi:hypothetical protein
MTNEKQIFTGSILALILLGACGAQTALSGQGRQSAITPSRNTPEFVAWECPARLRHGMIGGAAGILRIDSKGIEFQPMAGTSTHWGFPEIKDLDLQKNRMVLVGYDNRKWDIPGTRRFELEFKKEITPADAASLAAEIGRPVRNRVPDPDAPAITVIAVRRNEHFGGSNGVLRIRQDGIDYVTAQPEQSRSWRWLDLQTLSSPDPYHLFVFGYRDSYAFDLKEPLSRKVLNHLSDEIWTHNESDMRGGPPPLAPSALPSGGRREDE